jgi:hypothetical protein
LLGEEPGAMPEVHPGPRSIVAAPAPRASEASDDEDAGTAPEVPIFSAQLAKAALPFGAPPREEREPPVSEPPVTAPLPSTSPPRDVLPFRPAPPNAPSLTLEAYASLCAELAAFPDQSEAIFTRYGLENAQNRRAVDLAWQERLRRSPAELNACQELYQRALASWQGEARRLGRR